MDQFGHFRIYCIELGFFKFWCVIMNSTHDWAAYHLTNGDTVESASSERLHIVAWCKADGRTDFAQWKFSPILQDQF